MKYPFVIIKKVGDEWWYHGADKDLESASKVLFIWNRLLAQLLLMPALLKLKTSISLTN